jgi:hypothetical protein
MLDAILAQYNVEESEYHLLSDILEVKVVTIDDEYRAYWKDRVQQNIAQQIKDAEADYRYSMRNASSSLSFFDFSSAARKNSLERLKAPDRWTEIILDHHHRDAYIGKSVIQLTINNDHVAASLYYEFERLIGSRKMFINY